MATASRLRSLVRSSTFGVSPSCSSEPRARLIWRLVYSRRSQPHTNKSLNTVAGNKRWRRQNALAVNEAAIANPADTPRHTQKLVTTLATRSRYTTTAGNTTTSMVVTATSA